MFTIVYASFINSYIESFFDRPIIKLYALNFFQPKKKKKISEGIIA